MTQEQTVRIAEQLLAQIGSGAEPDEIAGVFSTDVQFEVPGDVGALAWIGRRTGRGAVSEFIQGTRLLLERVRLDVEGILANDDSAVILGDLASKLNATGRIIESPFALILHISDGKIARFQMLEDSFAVSRAARS
jgi:ketosteroid isomerase-like protein